MNNEVLECKHCKGTGLCKQSIVKSRSVSLESDYELDEDGDLRVDYHDYYRSVCEICGSTKEVENDRDNSRLVCKVCNGKGYIRISDLP
ncbi:MAG TPA: hypothetical protein VK469_09840 [Candidatus Kapabacteria bacterium]|nr:hypothetical protein [Candidatus Kapabacteria bacterium]